MDRIESSSEFLGKRSLKRPFKGRLMPCSLSAPHDLCSEADIKTEVQSFRISKASSSVGGTQKTPQLFT